MRRSTVAQVQLVDQGSQFGVVGRHAASDQHAAQAAVTPVAHQRGHGAQQVGVVFQRVPAGHAADHGRVFGQAPLRAHARAGLGVRRITRQVIAIGNDDHAVAPVALFGMAFGGVLRRAHDGARHAAGQQRASAQDDARRPAAAFQVFAGIADAPGNGAHAGQPRGQATDQVGVIHPGLHNVGTRVGDQAAQRHETAQAEAAALHAQGMHRDAGIAQALAVDAFIGQGHDGVRHTRFRGCRQTQQHGFRAALAQAGDHVQHM